MPVPLIRLAAVFLITLACGAKRTTAPVSTAPLPPLPPIAAEPDQLEGVASWYGHPFHGRRTSNGEVYDMDRLTAAHQTLPFDSLVRVENLDNGKKVEVRINDRGPFVKNRVIDLSRAAATAIDMIGPGTANVRIDVLERGAPIMTPPLTPTGELAQAPCLGAGYLAVQVGSFESLENAQRMHGKIELSYGKAAIHRATVDDMEVYRVLLGRFSSRDSAANTASKLSRDGVDAFVLTVEQSSAACLDDIT